MFHASFSAGYSFINFFDSLSQYYCKIDKTISLTHQFRQCVTHAHKIIIHPSIHYASALQPTILKIDYVLPPVHTQQTFYQEYYQHWTVFGFRKIFIFTHHMGI